MCVLKCSDSTEDKLSPRKDFTHTESRPNENYTKMVVYDVEIQHWHSGQVRNAGIMKAIDALMSKGCECTCSVKSITEDK